MVNSQNGPKCLTYSHRRNKKQDLQFKFSTMIMVSSAHIRHTEWTQCLPCLHVTLLLNYDSEKRHLFWFTSSINKILHLSLPFYHCWPSCPNPPSRKDFWLYPAECPRCNSRWLQLQRSTIGISFPTSSRDVNPTWTGLYAHVGPLSCLVGRW